MSDSFELLMAAYPSVEAAQQDFDKLAAAVADKSVKSDGIILVEHAADGQVKVTHTADNLGRKGLSWGGGVGVLVGLFNPAMLGAVVVGGAVGGLVGKFTKKKVDAGLEENLGEKLPAGAAVVIAFIDTNDRLVAERALSNTPAHSVAQMDGLDRPEVGARRSCRQVHPRARVSRSRQDLRRCRRTHDEGLGRRLVDDPRPGCARRRPERAARVDRRRRLRHPRHLWRPRRHTDVTRVGEMGVTYNRFHVTAVCSPTRAALLTGRNQHRVGLVPSPNTPGRSPATPQRSRSRAPGSPILRDNGYVTSGFGKWHLTPDNVQGAAGPFDHWPKSWGFDHWWVSSAAPPASTTRSSRSTTRSSACRPPTTVRSTTSPTTSPTKPSNGSMRSTRRTPTSRG